MYYSLWKLYTTVICTSMFTRYTTCNCPLKVFPCRMNHNIYNIYSWIHNSCWLLTSKKHSYYVQIVKHRVRTSIYYRKYLFFVPTKYTERCQAWVCWSHKQFTPPILQFKSRINLHYSNTCIFRHTNEFSISLSNATNLE